MTLQRFFFGTETDRNLDFPTVCDYNIIVELYREAGPFPARSIMKKIVVNKIRCNKCGSEIESYSVHDFKFCKCGAVAVDGGHEYLRRCGNLEDITDLSEWADEDD